ncbi:branched-chain amino acid ABC transporter permease [Ligilactobacillus agilis]|uniref:branched-chain amino acid ABC transporter permease n=1 Tax=Ligilactobacillus agilis TaxID=1601 RepID=UPI001F5625E5|nr:branched-chain amino acid ABC transporter permease [Ligilactobacillus agilis]UNL43047.1 branched-chain amino acid ABC transporter permease [Ligilactobacillus agilis]UNL59020.1 branched-chain amino acid ABC transporter permease [Ligilactobacillus agilis]
MKEKISAIIVWALLMVGGFELINLLMLAGIIDVFIENMLVTIGINIILATGLNLVIGFAGQFSLGHAGFMAIGAYATGIITQELPTVGGFYTSLIVGIFIALIMALIIGIPTFRLRGDYLAIATMGISEILRLIINNLKITNGAAGLYNIPQFATWPLVYVAVCVTTIITVNLINSKAGRAIMSVRNNEIAAESMGVNTMKWKLVAFSVGAMTAAVGGSMYASYLQTISPNNFGIMQSIAILIIVVLGGSGSITGTFLAATILGVLDTVLQSFGALRMVIYALVLIVMMIVRPSGFLGQYEISIATIISNLKRKRGKVHG